MRQETLLLRSNQAEVILQTTLIPKLLRQDDNVVQKATYTIPLPYSIVGIGTLFRGRLMNSVY